MMEAIFFAVISFVILMLGTNRIIRRNQHTALNWYFFAICVIMACITMNNAAAIYSAAAEGTSLNESSYVVSRQNMIFSSMQILLIPLIYGFIRNLSKNTSSRARILQISMNLVSALIFSGVIALALTAYNTVTVWANAINVMFYVLILSSLICLGHLLVGWIKSASLKREHAQAVMLTAAATVSFAGTIASMFIPVPWVSILIYTGQLGFLIICNHYAHQYNSFSFNVANLSEYVYTAVNLPVLILNEASGIVMHNAYAERFFQKTAAELNQLTLFALFETEAAFSAIHLNKKDNLTEHTNAVCRTAGQKCQLSLNYIYDKFEELVCAVVIVTDITEKEELIRQLNESNAKIAHYNEELRIEVERQTESIRNLQEAVVYSMSDLIEKKDGYTGGHTRRVGGYITLLLKELAQRGYPITDDEIQMVAKSSLLHDMGKIAIPDNILLKNGKLDDDEFDVMKAHSSIGADSLRKSMQMVKDNSFLEKAFEMAMYHHEKWNGRGYPTGIEGENIPFLARVIAIADVYDALRSKRPYKEPFSREKAKAIIAEEQGRQFDPVLVEVFLAVEPDFYAFSLENSNN